MKKNIIIIICVVIIIALAVTVGALAKRQADFAKRHEDTFRSCIEQTSYHLSQYIASGDENEYREAVSEIYAAVAMSTFIGEESSEKDQLVNDLWIVYGYLTQQPDKSAPYLEELNTALSGYTDNGSKAVLEYKLRNFTNHVDE